MRKNSHRINGVTAPLFEKTNAENKLGLEMESSNVRVCSHVTVVGQTKKTSMHEVATERDVGDRDSLVVTVRLNASPMEAAAQTPAPR